MYTIMLPLYRIKEQWPIIVKRCDFILNLVIVC